MPFLMLRNDITRVAADAIVNPANRNLLQGSGTSRAIYRSVYPGIRAACKVYLSCGLPGMARRIFWRSKTISRCSHCQNRSKHNFCGVPSSRYRI